VHTDNIPDYDYIGSAIGNAYFSGLSFTELWSCVLLSNTKEELDAAISASINLNELVNGETKYE
jgi:hypothetical protein